MSSSKVLKLMKDKEVEFVDLRFTDPRGKLQHLTMDSSVVDEGMLNEGVFFDGSSGDDRCGAHRWLQRIGSAVASGHATGSPCPGNRSTFRIHSRLE